MKTLRVARVSVVGVVVDGIVVDLGVTMGLHVVTRGRFLLRGVRALGCWLAVVGESFVHKIAIITEEVLAVERKGREE